MSDDQQLELELAARRPDGLELVAKRTRREGYTASCFRCGQVLARYCQTKLKALTEAGQAPHACRIYDRTNAEIPY